MSEEVVRSTRLFFREAIARALEEEMAADPRVFVLGQDVGSFGGSYREFDGLYEKFGASRVRDTPVAESAMVGIGIGAAAAGQRPLVCITYMDFMMLALDPLVNYGAKVRYKTAGRLTAPVVVKTTAGAKGQGVAHSQCIEAWLMSVPGLCVVAPSSPAEAYSLLRAALRQNGPVVYVDHKRLFPLAGDVVLGEIGTIGKAKIRRHGTDLTVTTHSYMTRVALQAAEALQEQGISTEVIDLLTLAPLDVKTITDSLQRTGALLTLEEGQSTCGVGAEVIARVQEVMGSVRCSRVAALPAPISSNPVLERTCLPDAARVVDAATTLLGKRTHQRS
jgi:pyruvate/2-oxoglutarate/acetoin dehydrogenase E1 component